jgi:hypothetical protein
MGVVGPQTQFHDPDEGSERVGTLCISGHLVEWFVGRLGVSVVRSSNLEECNAFCGHLARDR